MRYVLRAVGLFRRQPRLRRFVWRPMALTFLLFLGLIVILFSVLGPLVSSIGLPAWLAGASTPLAAVAVGVVLYFAFVPLFVMLAVTVSAFGWDRLSREVEQLTTGTCIERSPSFPVVFADGLRRQTLALVLFPLAAITGQWYLSLAVAAYLGLHDFGAPAFYRRGLLLRDQRRYAFRQRDWLTFALAAGFVALFPIVNLLMLPVFVAGGTLMFLDSRSQLSLD